MTLFILLGMIGLFFFMRMQNKTSYSIKWIHSLNKYEWFHNPWLVGCFLFGMNLVLFGTTGLILYVITLLMIPYLHLVIMMGAVIVSVLVWSSLVNSRAWGKGERLKVGVVGSSFYLFLSLFILYEWVTYVPQYPGEDGFMAFIGFFLWLLVTGMAFVICLVMVVFLPVDRRV
ncbi:hypothetical protein CN378_19570 [Bacillus sp. AFS015802]|uniref:hypothetical protein n=1 Tax=Bacillus sp. AFS015802 TaxID=2033486 RepID=UPI000BF98910|nr:hypothetical protein [Bacillus sp. AFS015802]PFA63220.1 hypothetical protein CN378_19570 [Bacillus sp. AFS015802]